MNAVLSFWWGGERAHPAWPRPDSAHHSCCAQLRPGSTARCPGRWEKGRAWVNSQMMQPRQRRKWSRSVVSDLLWPHGLYPARFLCPGNSLGKNTRVGCHFILQGILPTQGLNLDLPHCGQILYHLSHKGSSQCKEGPNAIRAHWGNEGCLAT